jgi:hypothetical protein
MSGTWSWFGSNLMAAARSTLSADTRLAGAGGGSTPTVNAVAVAVAALTNATLIRRRFLVRCKPAI